MIIPFNMDKFFSTLFGFGGHKKFKFCESSIMVVEVVLVAIHGLWSGMGRTK